MSDPGAKPLVETHNFLATPDRGYKRDERHELSRTAGVLEAMPLESADEHPTEERRIKGEETGLLLERG